MDSETTIGVGTIGSSEVIMLAGITLKRIWHKMRAAAKPFDKPNIVTGANGQVCWEKFAKYFDVEVNEVKFSEGHYVMDPENAVEMVKHHLCLCYFGFYRQWQIAKRGIAENDLAKKLGTKNNKIFHVLQGFESRRSIVRQSTITRKKEVCSEGEYTSGSVIDTNMLYLYHYVKQLGQLQRLEIRKEDKTSFDNQNNDMEVASGNGVSEERIADFVHVIRAICDKL
ncbi:B-block binding subunit of TFIIIC [Tanacetum coccineum]